LSAEQISLNFDYYFEIVEIVSVASRVEQTAILEKQALKG
jgi:hypothetical protein